MPTRLPDDDRAGGIAVLSRASLRGHRARDDGWAIRTARADGNRGWR